MRFWRKKVEKCDTSSYNDGKYGHKLPGERPKNSEVNKLSYNPLYLYKFKIENGLR